MVHTTDTERLNSNRMQNHFYSLLSFIHLIITSFILSRVLVVPHNFVTLDAVVAAS